MVEEVEAAREEESGDEPAQAQDNAAAANKKKKKKKKKTGAANEAEDAGAQNEGKDETAVVVEEVAQPTATTSTPEPSTILGEEAAAEDEEDEVKKKEKEAAAEDDEEDGPDGENAAAGAASKKKRRKKKKAATQAEVTTFAVVGPSGEKLSFAERKELMPDAKAFTEFCSAAIAKHKEDDFKGKSPQELLRMPKNFFGYKFTGSLRPGFVAHQRSLLDKGIGLPDYATHPDGYCESERTGPKEIPVLAGEDLKVMREACTLGREVLDIAARFMRVGVTGDEIDRVVFQACVDRKIYPSPLNYYKFPKSLCVSANEVICHGIPDCRPIEAGDIVNLDISVYHKGFHSDLNETYFVGECDEASHTLVRTAYNSLQAASKLIRPGTFYRDLGNAISAEASRNGCSVVSSYCGHGVGRLFHGPPKVPHYKRNKATGIMKPGHVFTVEPMINLGSSPWDVTWPDNWTAVTKDGKRSAQFEHTFLVTEDGLELLTARTGAPRNCMSDFDPLDFQC